ncbi:MAG: hypothetical protein H7250_00325 [Flavobacterium sp.]|nr:hypothetical protein [Flavobacterium sp.]
MNKKIIDYLVSETKYKPIKLTEKISEILNISFDSAYRRVSNKVEFSVSELEKIALFYKFSIDEVLFLSSKKNVLFLTPETVNNTKTFLNFLEETNKIVFDYINKPDTTIYYSAKDIPFYYTIGQNLLSKLKFYIWMYSTNPDFHLKKILFSEFSLTPEITTESLRISFLNDTTNTSEIWNTTTIDSALYAIEYLNKVKLISIEEIESIINELRALLASIKLYATSGKKQYDKKFELYYNSLFVMNNSVLFKSRTDNTAVIQYNLIEYLNTKNYKICTQLNDYFNNQIHLSKNLTKSNENDRNYFFELLYNKINAFIGNNYILNS